ncbi:MAG: thioredoxin 1 [Methanolobus sp.]|jgi:thioredoxin 1|uniref:Thioredoxin n=1 Tax=Methanolobus tindarius DSM 2278 TaxID=1090322 RepID=W9DSA1_METTI|nr:MULTISPECIES: thioredoxin [Methanolobus]ETA68500.1 thioredoxin [Methanolobus tindarius DSM 2278]MDI3485214.1 thioredoxin 1 [Methanolobus sp.]MDK2831700.1 thioredoxin 1 [Methanolobus sp.]MDK2939001.1 thioredoxin 1 [Methanolobus sp.]
MDDIESIRQKRMQQLQESLEKKEFPSDPVTINDASFNEFVSKYPLVLVDCWAPWCGPCRMLSPVLDELATEMQGKVVFGKLNVDEEKMTAVKFGITSIPAMLIFKNGEYVDKLIGAVPKQNIIQKLQPYI